MVRKIAALAGAGAILLSVAVPALAHHRRGSSDTAIVINGASAVASSGYNTQGNFVAAGDDVRGGVNVSGNNNMSTGKATAYAGALVVANTHVGCCPDPSCDTPCLGVSNRGRGGSSHQDFAMVVNSAGAGAYTGDNDQGNFVSAVDDVGSRCGGGETRVSGNNVMDTDNADAESRAWVIVNTHWDL